MAETSIEWTDEVWNPVVGCWHKSTGCKYCYAETMHRTRLNGRHGYPEFRPWTKRNADHNVTLMPHRLDQPLRWRKPRMIFVNSMSDLFVEELSPDYIAQVFAVMCIARRHTFQVLTKRPSRMARVLNDPRFWDRVRFHLDKRKGLHWMPTDEGEGPPELPNVWLGTSIENVKWIGRADDLRLTPAAVRFISAEPLLGPLVRSPWGNSDTGVWPDDYDGPELDLWRIDWLIVGGESGTVRRPFELSWAHDLREAARASKTAFFMKQMGGLRPGGKLEDLPETIRVREMPDKSVILSTT